MRRVIFAVLSIALIAVSSHAWYRAIHSRQADVLAPELQAFVLPRPLALSDFELADQRNDTFGKEQLLGRWTMMFFGYTQCPDICPTTMLTLKQVGLKLGESDALNPRMVLVSVDPERDDTASLGRYVEYLGEDFLGVRGSDEQLQALSGQVGAMFERDAPDANGNYQVAHSGSIFVMNPAGELHAVFSAPHRSDYIADRMLAISDRYGSP